MTGERSKYVPQFTKIEIDRESHCTERQIQSIVNAERGKKRDRERERAKYISKDRLMIVIF